MITEEQSRERDRVAHHEGDHSNCPQSTTCRDNFDEREPDGSPHSNDEHGYCPLEWRCRQAHDEQAQLPDAIVHPIHSSEELQWHEGVVQGDGHPRVLEIRPDDILLLPSPPQWLQGPPSGLSLVEVLGCSRVYCDASLDGPWVLRRAER
jgi:hypothetical protein